jgi:Zn-dependent protease with chaperone function
MKFGAATTSDPQPAAKRQQAAIAQRVLPAFDFTVPRRAIPPGYGVAMGLLAGCLTLIPLIYLALLAFLLYLVAWHTYQSLATLSQGPYFAFHVPMALLGGSLLLFLVKPVFFRKRPDKIDVVSISQTDEPLLFACVAKLCAAIGCVPPSRIEVDCDANAHARFQRGIISGVRGDLVLRIGLPLAQTLTLRQFIGILAHEFGHFNQRHGMSGSYLIRRLMHFFAQVVFQRDKIDERLARLRYSNYGPRRACFWLLSGPIEAARGVLWLLLTVGSLVTCGVLRRMEYDADRNEALVAGTHDFVLTCRHAVFLQLAVQLARGDVTQTWETRRLPDNLPALIAINGKYAWRDRDKLLGQIEQQTTGWLDTHPSLHDRIQEVERLNAEPLLKLEAPATWLFSDFEDLCQRASQATYRRVFGAAASETTLMSSQALGQERLAEREAIKTLRRYLRGHIVSMRPVFPDVDADRPIEVSPAAAIESLRSAREPMLAAAGRLGPGVQNIAKDTVTLAASRAQMAVCEIFTRSPNAARIHSRAYRTVRKTQPSLNQTLDRYTPFASAASLRLTGALRLLQSDGVRFTGSRGTEYPLAQRRIRATQLLAVSRVLERISLRMNRLGNSFISIRVLMSSHNKNRPNPPLVRKILAEVKDADEIIREASNELAPVAFPFPHATPGISIASVVAPRFPAERNPADAINCAATALSAYSVLVIRVLAELSQIAEEVENAVGIEPLPAIEPLDKPAVANDRPADVKRYWIKYSGRAAAGIAMFTFLLWLSIHPPVVPAMPWDNGVSPAGYQPDSFHVPFSRPQQEIPQYAPQPPIGMPVIPQMPAPTIPNFPQPRTPTTPNFPQPPTPIAPAIPRRPSMPTPPPRPATPPPQPQIPVFRPPPMPQPRIPSPPSGSGGRGG